MCIGIGPFTGAQVIYLDHISEENWYSLVSQPSAANGSSARVGTP